MKTPPKAFITYSHKNTAQRERLEIALAVMISNGEIEICSDAQILPGNKWGREIAENLKKSDILLYLVSADSLASVNCNKELAAIVKASNIPVIPIILEDCDFLHHPLTEFEALPTRDKNIVPISRWKKSSKGWQNVVDGIRKKIASIPCKPIQGEPDAPSSTSKELQLASLTREQVMVGLFNHANFFLMLGNNDFAIADYSKVINLNPNNTAAYNNRGVAYEKNGNDRLAIEDFNKAIELDSNYATAYNNRGVIYEKNGNDEYAIDNYTKAISLNPKDAVVYYNRGIVHRKNDDNDSAIADYNKAIELDPNYVEAYNNRGNIYDKKGKEDCAIADYDKAISLNPNNAKAYYNRASTYRKKGEKDCAIADYNKAILLNPNYVEAYNNRGSTYDRKGEYDLAIADYNKAILLNPKGNLVYYNRGVVYGKKGKNDSATVDFNKAIELNPNYVEAYFNLGITKKILQDYKGAREDLETALWLAKQQENEPLADRIRKAIDNLPNDSDS